MSLDQLAIRHGADKSSKVHNYTPHYERHLGHLRNSELVLLECGYGGYHYPDRGGAGAKMWADYFERGKIITIDFYNKVPPQNPRIKFIQGSQDDSGFLNSVIDREGAPDIIVDDASHLNELCIKSFSILFPLLKSGGFYIIEDLESSWWQDIAVDGTDFKGCSDPSNFSAATTINFLRTLLNDVNASRIPNYNKAFDIQSLSFYNNIVFIQKK